LGQDAHAKAVRDFFADLSDGGWTSVWVPHKINATWARCPSCGKMLDRVRVRDRCGCGAELDSAPAYW
jgi:hypothetical protein